MSDYFAFVVCRHDGSNRNFLFYAPAFTEFKNGDRVLVNTCHGEQLATVIASCTAESGSDVEKALRTLCGADNSGLKRVVGKFVFRKFEYKEGEDNE